MNWRLDFLVGIHYHKLDHNENVPVSSEVDFKSDVLQRPLILKTLFIRLAESVGINSERGVVILSLEDGPIAAQQIIDGITDKHMIDKIVPVYLTEADTPRGASLSVNKISELKDDTGKSLKNSAALSAFFDGKRGENFLNSVNSLRDVNLEQTSLNVYFPKSKEYTLYDYIDPNVSVNLGYSFDSIESHPNEKDFLDLLSRVRPRDIEYTELTLKKFLVDIFHKYNTPLRSVEIIRAAIIGLLEGRQDIDHSKLRWSLQPFYETLSKLDPLLKFDYEKDKITQALLDQLKKAGIINYRGFVGTGNITKGPNWNSATILVKTYSGFYHDEVEGGKLKV